MVGNAIRRQQEAAEDRCWNTRRISQRVASPHKKGRQPYWPGSLFRAHVVSALKEAGITVPVGWHTLRHTFGTLMKANGEDLKIIQEMLRHATFKVTADIYTQAITPTKREAHNKVVKLLIAEPCRSDAEDAK